MICLWVWTFLLISGFEKNDCAPVVNTYKQNTTHPLRLTGGSTHLEGNVEIYFRDQWGSVCDDDWTIADAAVVCKQLGFKDGALRSTTDSYFGHTLEQVWMDNVDCTGHETELANCKSDGWGVHDCTKTEAAGVICKQPPEASTKAPSEFDINDLSNKIRISNLFNSLGPLSVQISGGRTFKEGQVQLQVPKTQSVAVFCADRWTLREAAVVCRQLGLKHAQQAVRTDYFGAVPKENQLIIGVYCTGNEQYIGECVGYPFDQDRICANTAEVAGVVCNEDLPDLTPDVELIQSSVYLHDQAMFYLQCAMEENCLSKSAYDLASFCLEDSDCQRGVAKFYSCRNYGEQGITVGCWDQYLHDIDCQWIDITDVKAGQYKLKITVNPEYRVAETNYTNNAAICDLYYNLMQVYATNCRLSSV